MSRSVLSPSACGWSSAPGHFCQLPQLRVSQQDEAQTPTQRDICVYLGEVSQGRGKTVRGHGARTHHWSYQGRGALSRVGACWGRGSLAWLAEQAGPPTCRRCPCGRCSSEPCTSSPLQTHEGDIVQKRTGQGFPGQKVV